MQIQAIELDDLDSSSSGLDNSDLGLLYNKFNALLRQNSTRWAQRAKLKWPHNGDLNTSFFYNSVRIHRHTNYISHIMDEQDLTLRDRDHIESAFVNHYTYLWNEPSDKSYAVICQALLNDLIPIPSSDCEILIRDVTKEEVFKTLISLPVGKSPGSDGFNIEFYKFFWDDVGDQLFEAIKYFFDNTSMPKPWGKTYVTLVPKKEHPKRVSDFRSISLCNVCYKIITKIMANRLRDVLDNLISREQSGFDLGRTPLDNIIATQEIMHSINQDRANPFRMLIKVDIEKAYDTLKCNAILAALARMGFPSIWISWVRACLSSTSFSLLINGQPISWVTPSRGLRQGDPISPYLFIIVSQTLSAF